MWTWKENKCIVIVIQDQYLFFRFVLFLLRYNVFCSLPSFTISSIEFEIKFIQWMLKKMRESTRRLKYEWFFLHNKYVPTFAKIIPFSERKGYRLLKWVGKSLKTLFVRSNQETVRIIVTNIDHLWSEVSWILGYRARGVRIWCPNIKILLLVFSSWSSTNT